MSYLHEGVFYNDLYDLFTIKECLPVSERWQEYAKKNRYLDAPDKSMVKFATFGSDLQLHFLKGERYKRKASTIKEWQDRDRAKDQKLENAIEPRNISCPSCSRRMKVLFKDLHDWSPAPERVLFILECSSCKKRQGIFEDGTPYLKKEDVCPKCNQTIDQTHTRAGDVITTIRQCARCGFLEKEVDDWAADEIRRKQEEVKDRLLLEQYRHEFCLSEKEGYEYLEGCRNVEELGKLVEEAEHQQNDPDYKKAGALKKLTVVAMEKLLGEALQKERYMNLRLEAPKIDRYVIIPFIVQESDSSRQDRVSELRAQRVIRDALASTNWRLMSQGISYRLGYLSGELKGYERDEDLVQLVKLEDGKALKKKAKTIV